MPKKIINTDGHGGSVEYKTVKSRAKPKPWIQSEYVTNYIIERDRVIWKTCDQETKEKLKEKYGKI